MSCSHETAGRLADIGEEMIWQRKVVALTRLKSTDLSRLWWAVTSKGKVQLDV